jgi:hypothetical protein
MKISRTMYTAANGWTEQISGLSNGNDANLVLVFGGPSLISDASLMAGIKSKYPDAQICGCSTAGEIAGRHVHDDSVTATAIQFECTTIQTAEATVNEPDDSFRAGQALAEALPANGLKHAFILSDGLSVNGSELVKGISSGLPAGVTVTGGLSGDGTRFGQTFVYSSDTLGRNRVVILGFYGERLKFSFGSMGGWDPFGPERRVTRSKRNILYELDHRSALDLYREYLGPHSGGLPASGLLFPLTIRGETSDERVVRTILGMNEADGSLIFAGDVPEGSMARLMRANFDRLVDGAGGAAKACQKRNGAESAELAILISCVGRKLVLKQRIEEEVEAVVDVLGDDTVTTGFYSYGEISPSTSDVQCALHNQTMTITTFSER